MYKVTLKNGVTVECNDAHEALALGQSLDNQISIYPKTIETKKMSLEDAIVQSQVKRKYHKKGSHSQWTGEEINIVAENLNLTCRKLAKMIPGRTPGAIGNIKWALKSNRLDGKRFKNYEKWLLSR